MISSGTRDVRQSRKALRLSSCCMFASLSTGCAIISIISMCESLMYIFGLSRVIYHCTNVSNIEENETKSSESDDDDEDSCPISHVIDMNQFLAVASFMLFVMIIFFLVSLLMYFGVRNRKYKLLYPWLWWNIGEMIVTFYSISPRLGQTFSPWRGVMILLIEVYFCVIVYSHIEELKEPPASDDIVDVVSYVTMRNGGLSNVHPRSYVVPGSSRRPCSSTHQPTQHEMIYPVDLDNKMDGDTRRLYGDQPPPYSPPLPSNGVDGAGTNATSASSHLEIPSTPPPSYYEVAGSSNLTPAASTQQQSQARPFISMQFDPAGQASALGDGAVNVNLPPRQT
ncbi:uncharacterized protein LOC108665126 [Hyalella azteca]|uniref:Uncharacterized protein LOC108665126 n=1 Tax=Hyalella azteca TaxID=294128 RepID=A0A8B7N0I4_HYAAZ|nr:uncharacterized protein LOC108665126 [Hyalella azteca]